MTKVIFANLNARQNVYKRRTMLHTTKGIWVNEDLTLRRGQLNYQARTLFRAGVIKKNWTYLGQLFIKVANHGPALKIHNMECLKTAVYLQDVTDLNMTQDRMSHSARG